MTKFIQSVLVALGLVSCAPKQGYSEITVADLKNADQNITVLDVRTPAEFAEGHVPGAVLIPLQELEARIKEVPDGAINVICRSGNRSKTASDILLKNGRTDVRNVLGGTLAWASAGYPLER
jgi:rhodanese-related sulfurtransferase